MTEMLFQIWTRVGKRNHVAPDSTMQRCNF